MPTEIEKLTVALRAEAQAWERAMQKRDPDIGSKIWAYLDTGAYEDAMSTKLIQLNEAVKEVRHG